MRQRFLQYGLDNFSDHEVLELLLYYAVPRGDVNPMAHRMLDSFGTLSAVFDAEPEQLMKECKVSERTAMLIHFMPQLFRRYRLSNYDKNVFDSTEKVGQFLVDYYIGHANELITLIVMDNKSRIMAVTQLAEGDPNSVRINYRAIMQEIVKYNAAAVILAHNHPGGICTPSRQDFVETKMVRDLLDKIGVKLLDHIIVAGDEWTSVASYTGR